MSNSFRVKISDSINDAMKKENLDHIAELSKRL